MSPAKLSRLLSFFMGWPLAAWAVDPPAKGVVRVEAEDAKTCRVEGGSSAYVYPRSIGRRVLALEAGSRVTVSGTGRAVYLCLPPTFQTPGPSYDLGTATKIRWRIDGGPPHDLWPAASPQIVALNEALAGGSHAVEISAAENSALVDAFIFAAEPLAAVRGVILTDHYSELLTDVRADLMADGEVMRSECVRSPANGSFVLLDVPPGSYRLRFSANGWITRESSVFTIAHAGQKVDLGTVVLPFDRELVPQWPVDASTVRLRSTLNAAPGGSFDAEMEMASPVREAWLVSGFKTIPLKIAPGPPKPMPQSHDPVHAMTFHVPAGTPHDMYALRLRFDGGKETLPGRWPRAVCVREPLPESFAVAGIGHNNTWGQETSEYLARMAEMAQLSGARTLLISNEVNAAYIAGALKLLRIPYAVTAGNHTMSRWDDFFPPQSRVHDDGAMRIVTFGNDINDSWSEVDERFAARPEATVRILACFEAHPPIDVIRRGKMDLLFDGHGGGAHVDAGQFPSRTFHLRPPGQESMLWFPMDREGVAPQVKTPGDVPRMSMARDGPPPLRVEYSGANDGSATVLTARVINDTKVHFPTARLRLLMRRGRYSISGGTVLQQFASDDGKVTVIDAETAVPQGTVVEVVAKVQP